MRGIDRKSLEAIEAALASGAAKVTGAVNAAALLGPPTLDVDAEKDFQAAVEKEARRLGWLVYHTRDSRKSAAGFPDAIALRAGRLVVAELKVGDNKPTADQLTWLEEFRKVPAAEVFVWVPEQWAEILEVLR